MTRGDAERGERVEGAREHLVGRGRCANVIKGDAAREIHGAGARATQPRQVRGSAGGAPEVAGEAPDVGALRNVEIAGPARLAIRHGDLHELSGEDLHPARGKLHDLARPRTRVRAPAVDRDGRERGRDLVLLPDERLEKAPGIACVGHARGRGDDLRDGALGVVGVRLAPEGDGRAIRLALRREVAHEAGALSDAHDHDARGCGVERAGMADAPLAQRPADVVDDVMARHADGLVDAEKCVDPALASPHRVAPSSALPSKRATSLGRVTERASSMPASIVKPAAAL